MDSFDTRQEMIKKLNLYGKFAEIGVFKGEFSKEILNYCPNITEMHLVDSWVGKIPSGDQDGNNVKDYDGEKLYKSVLKNYKNNSKVKIFRQSSEEYLSSIPDNFLNSIYIDADHSYEGCLKDLKLALRKVKKNGWILGHDYEFTSKCNHEYDFGVKKAVDEICGKFGLSINSIALDGCVSYAIKNNPAPLSFALCSLSDRDYFSSIAWKSMLDYCNAHDYEFYYTREVFDKSRHPSWSKILLINELLSRPHDIIIWMDDDIVITEPQLSMDKILSDFIHSDKLICVCEDTNGSIFNAGIMIVKNSTKTKDLLQNIYNNFNGDEKFWEQTSMTRLYENDPFFKSFIHIYPAGILQGFFSPYYGERNNKFNWKPGLSFSCHLAGRDYNDRLRIMKYLSNKYSEETLDLLYH